MAGATGWRTRTPASALMPCAGLSPGEIAYIILEGSAKIHIDQPDGSDVILAILGAGAIVGEMSLADSLGRSASVCVLEPSTFLLIDRASFWASLREMPMMAYNLMNILSRRLRLANLHAQAAWNIAPIVAGRITDGGAAVSDALVRASSASAMSGGSEARTDASGAFTIEGLAPGHYTFTAAKAGFAPGSLLDVDGGSVMRLRVGRSTIKPTAWRCGRRSRLALDIVLKQRRRG